MARSRRPSQAVTGRPVPCSNGRPTAIVAASDLMAFGAIRAAGELEYEVPGDLSVAGSDDIPVIPVASFITPALATVRQHAGRIGEKAVEILWELIEGSGSPPEPAVLDVELVVRGSCAAPRPAGRARNVGSSAVGPEKTGGGSPT